MCKQSEGISEETPDGQWPPGGVIGMRTQSEGAVEERRNGKCRQGRASGGGCGGAVAVVPAGKKRKGSSRNGCELGPSSTAAAASSSTKEVLSGMKERKWRGDEDGAGSSGRGRKRTLRGGGVANGVLATIQGSTTSVDARTEAPGVDGEGRNEVTEVCKRDGIKEEWVYMLGGWRGGHLACFRSSRD
jgi:hypothetical protein